MKLTKKKFVRYIQVPFDTGDDLEDEGYEPPVNMNPFVREIAGRKKRMRRSSVLPHPEEMRAQAESSLSLDDMTLRKVAGAQEAEQVKISGSGNINTIHSCCGEHICSCYVKCL